MGDHTEALQIEFDPSEISFDKIVQMFWSSHDPARGSWNRQYMAAFWYQDERQADIVNSAKKQLANATGCSIKTPVAPLDYFYLAENYHQKYALQQHKHLMTNFNSVYPEFEDFVNSTAAARLNGFVYGLRSDKLLELEKASYGLPVDEVEALVAKS